MYGSHVLNLNKPSACKPLSPVRVCESRYRLYFIQNAFHSGSSMAVRCLVLSI